MTYTVEHKIALEQGFEQKPEIWQSISWLMAEHGVCSLTFEDKISKNVIEGKYWTGENLVSKRLPVEFYCKLDVAVSHYHVQYFKITLHAMNDPKDGGVKH